MNFEQIKKNYDKGLWSKSMVRIAVVKGIISISEYREITGERYTSSI